MRKIRLYPSVERRLATVRDGGMTRVGRHTLRSEEGYGALADYMPQPGLQEELCASEANLIFICGEATSGKTYGMFMKALKNINRVGFTARLISVRLQDSKKGSSIFRDAVKVCGNFAGCQYSASDYPTFYWPRWNSSLQLIHSNFNTENAGEWLMFQDYAKKNQASLIMVDEATEMRQFRMFTYWFSRNRDSSGAPSQMVLSFNPLHEHWTTEMLKNAGYLTDDWYLNPEMIGRVRYFYNKGNTPEGIVWGDSRAEVVEAAGLTVKAVDAAAGMTAEGYVKSFTVLTGSAADNRTLVHATGGQSVANLHQVGEEERQRLSDAYFGPRDESTVSVSRRMIQDLWTNPLDDDTTRYATMDISSGTAEADKAPMIIWQGLRMIALELFTGRPEELAGWISGRLAKYGVAVENFAFDATGHGYWVQAFTRGIPVTWNRRPLPEYDEHGNRVEADSYYNIRSQLLAKTEVLLKTGAMSCAISADMEVCYGHRNVRRRFVDILFDEANLFIATRRGGKTYYRSTDEFKARFHFSPDITTTIALRAVFQLDTRPRKQAPAEVAPGAYRALFRRKPRYGFR